MNSELKVLVEQAAKGIVDNLFGQDIPCVPKRAGIEEAILDHVKATYFTESEKATAKTLLEESQADGFDVEKTFAYGVAFGRKMLKSKDFFVEKKKEMRPINKRKSAIINALKESAAKSARLVAIYPDHLLLENDGRYFECRYVVTDEKAELFGPVEEMEPKFYPKEIAARIEEQLQSEAKLEIFNLKVAGLYVPPPLEPIEIDEKMLTERQRRDLRIAGLL
jgi:hypothetical protein